jgi:hypothetical protein
MEGGHVATYFAVGTAKIVKIEVRHAGRVNGW